MNNRTCNRGFDLRFREACYNKTCIHHNDSWRRGWDYGLVGCRELHGGYHAASWFVQYSLVSCYGQESFAFCVLPCVFFVIAGLDQTAVEVVAAVAYFLISWILNCTTCGSEHSLCLKYAADMNLIIWSWPNWSGELFQDTCTNNMNIFLSMGWLDVVVADAVGH